MNKVWYHHDMAEKPAVGRKLSKKISWYQATEALLYNHKSFPIRIRSLQQRLELVRQQYEPSMVASYDPHEGKTYSVSSPVETAAINRIESQAVQKLEQAIVNMQIMQEIVEVSISTMLDDSQKRLVEMIYVRKQPWPKTCEDLSIEKNTYYTQKNEIVQVLAWCFGYLPDDEAEQLLGIFMDQALWQQNWREGKE